MRGDCVVDDVHAVPNRVECRKKRERACHEVARMKRRLDAAGYASDKAELSHYLRNYEEWFEPCLERDMRMLELGICKGGSLQMWRDYFPRGIIAGVDLELPDLDDPTGRIRMYKGSQADTSLLDRVGREVAPEGFDIIIDDCSHIGELTRISFWHLFVRHLKPGGLYVIEDWGTAYWDAWVDGRYYRRGASSASFVSRLSCALESRLNLPVFQRLFRRGRSASPFWSFFPSHSYGMAGFLKELVDECAMRDITREDLGIGSPRGSSIERLEISRSHALVVKARVCAE